MRSLVIKKSITNRESITLKKYLNEVSTKSLLSVEEETELSRLIKEGDQLALKKLISGNLRFVISVAKQYLGSGVPLEDLISEGNIGLIKAAKRYDETRGFKFISYAVWWIRQSILSCIAEHSRMVRLPANQTSNIIKMKRAAEKFEQEMERTATVEELAEVLEVPTEQVEISGRHQSFHISLDTPFGYEDSFCLSDTIADQNIADTDNELITESLQIELRRYLKCLNPLERTIIINYFGLGKPNSMSLYEIATKKNLSSERIRQIKNLALSKLKSYTKHEFNINKI